MYLQCHRLSCISAVIGLVKKQTVMSNCLQAGRWKPVIRARLQLVSAIFFFALVHYFQQKLLRQTLSAILFFALVHYFQQKILKQTLLHKTWSQDWALECSTVIGSFRKRKKVLGAAGANFCVKFCTRAIFHIFGRKFWQVGRMWPPTATHQL